MTIRAERPAGVAAPWAERTPEFARTRVARPARPSRPAARTRTVEAMALRAAARSRASTLWSVALVVIAAGMTWMVALALDAEQYYGVMADAPCLQAGSCTTESLEALQTMAWWRVLPGFVLVLAGLALALAAARSLPARSTPVWPSPESPAGSPWRLGSYLALGTFAVEAVAVGPVILAVIVADQLGATALVGAGVALAALLTIATHPHLGLRTAAPVALAATAAGVCTGAAIIAGSWATGQVYLEMVVVLAVVPPVAAAFAGVGVHALLTLPARRALAAAIEAEAEAEALADTRLRALPLEH